MEPENSYIHEDGSERKSIKTMIAMRLPIDKITPEIKTISEKDTIYNDRFVTLFVTFATGTYVLEENGNERVFVDPKYYKEINEFVEKYKVPDGYKLTIIGTGRYLHLNGKLEVLDTN
jgi:hypothetical protein